MITILFLITIFSLTIGLFYVGHLYERWQMRIKTEELQRIIKSMKTDK